MRIAIYFNAIMLHGGHKLFKLWVIFPHTGKFCQRMGLALRLNIKLDNLTFGKQLSNFAFNLFNDFLACPSFDDDF
jgi:hypothetical protein